MTKSIGKTLEEMWLAVGYSSLGELHRDSGISVATLSRIKNDVQKPTPETLKKLAPCLNVDHTDLLKIVGYISGSNFPANENKKPKDLQKFLDNQEVMFDGVPLTEDDKGKIRKALEIIFWDAKQQNKRKKS